MSIYDNIWRAFSFDGKSVEELIEISSFIDAGKSNSEALENKREETAQIASVVVALINEKSTATAGNWLYEKINELIVTKNLALANEKDGRALYEELMRKQDDGKFLIKALRAGFSFVLKSSSGEVLAVSEIYKSAESCAKGIEAVRKNASAEIEDQTQESVGKVSLPKFEIYVDKVGEFRFRLKAKNGEPIAASEGYKTKAACLLAIEAVKRNASTEYVEKA